MTRVIRADAKASVILSLTEGVWGGGGGWGSNDGQTRAKDDFRVRDSSFQDVGAVACPIGHSGTDLVGYWDYDEWLKI